MIAGRRVKGTPLGPQPRSDVWMMATPGAGETAGAYEGTGMIPWLCGVSPEWWAQTKLAAVSTSKAGQGAPCQCLHSVRLFHVKGFKNALLPL